MIPRNLLWLIGSVSVCPPVSTVAGPARGGSGRRCRPGSCIAAGWAAAPPWSWSAGSHHSAQPSPRQTGVFTAELRSRWSRYYLRPGAGAKIIFLINIYCSQFNQANTVKKSFYNHIFDKPFQKDLESFLVPCDLSFRMVSESGNLYDFSENLPINSP